MRTKTGIITSTKMTGTVTVITHRHLFHSKYRKRFRVSKKFLADTNGMDLREGDLVEITECRPLSKNKRFRVTSIVQKAPEVSELKEEDALEKAVNREKPEQASKKNAKEEKADSPDKQ